MKKIDFGYTLSGEKATLYTITNILGMSLSVTDYGATWVKMILPDKNNNMKDVVLGYDTVKDYESGTSFFGAIVGRNGNRIGAAKFKIGDILYSLDNNDNGNNLHSGMNYFSKRMWKVHSASENSITFIINSPHLDQGFPGNANIEVTYTLKDDGCVQIEYYATSDKDTIFNMTNHSYFNLNGHNSGDILNQTICIDADYYTSTDVNLIPTGELLKVANTPMDFRSPKCIGKDIETDYEALNIGLGYDHNFVLNHANTYRKVVAMKGTKSGICMDVYTDLPGIQFYSGNFLTTEKGKNDCKYNHRQAVCLETQCFPDSINHSNFPSPIYKKGDIYKTKTTYKFHTGNI